MGWTDIAHFYISGGLVPCGIRVATYDLMPLPMLDIAEEKITPSVHIMSSRAYQGCGCAVIP
ncbi:hypothetical protein N7489_006442 [Penicillium chrysogenum]|uniref:Uncharacterized protein n=1 Tax=Penicillium chrysogenum TaxID=5076 RepID=A0ABQ8W500_PENCH|nr:uncharacterized protein N7489_006442 [Penicillium chrysogenum]KAJ5236351.1 hypothetical protein N7489_006442 [Penicillium chrysogenum]KAJ5255255.1 hypothetical protein N7505_010406 [Penicillium chrysogenum]KAJ5276290.1 hypothetical protein N7524_002443 [Penicillium chrysogenum]KAJ6152944.1 hypothetical protein N7497_007263 [Penicillium chrysogenum]